MQDTPIADPDKFSLDEGTGDPQADADRLLDEARTLDSQETASVDTPSDASSKFGYVGT